MSRDTLKKERNGFTMVPNDLISDGSISGKAKAVWCYLYSRPDDWAFHVTEIANNFKEGRDAIYSAIGELISHGWIKKTQVKDESGRFSHNEFDIYVYARPVDDDTVYGKPVDGNDDTTNTYNTNTDINKTDGNKKTSKKESSTEIEIVEAEVIEEPTGEKAFEEFWAVYPSKKAKGRARVAFRVAIKKTSLQTILGAIAMHKRSKKWTEQNGKYIPHPATWLNGECWDDEMTMADVSTADYVGAVLNGGSR